MDQSIFYSNAKKGILSIRQEKATPLQWLHMLINSGYLKKGEDKWIDLSGWLERSEEKTLNKADILTYIEDHKIQLEELIFDSNNSLRANFTTVGATNKKEIVFTVPDIESWHEDDDIHFGKQTNGKAIAWARIGEVKNEEGKILIIDEIQSARHQTRKIISEKNIPPAPFEKNWFEMVMKRMFRYAAENHFDKIAWTTGEQQSERYDLSSLVLKNLIYIPKSMNQLFPGQLIIEPQNCIPTFHPINDLQDLMHITGPKVANKIKAGQWNMESVNLDQNGLKELYDNVLPAFVKKYCKKWDAEIKLEPILGHEMYMLPVTEKMCLDVMQGQAMFKRERESQNSGITLKDIAPILKTLEETLKSNIEIIKNRSELPKKLLLGMAKNRRYPGLYDVKRDKAYLILSEISDKKEVEKVIKHEVLGHKGLRALKKEKLNEFLDEVFPTMPEADKERYLKVWNDKYIATEEYICDQAETYKNLTRWESIKTIFRSCMRNWGFDIGFSNTDLRYILSQGRRLLQQTTSLINVSAKEINGQKIYIAKLSQALSDRAFEKIVSPIGRKWNGHISTENKIIIFKDKQDSIQFKNDICQSLKKILTAHSLKGKRKTR